MDKKIIVMVCLVLLSSATATFETAALGVDYSLVEEVDRLEKVQNSINATKDKPAFKEANEEKREDIRKSCMSLGKWGRYLGDKLGIEADKAKAYRICGQFEDFKKTHPRAYASISPKVKTVVVAPKTETKTAEEPLKGDSFEMLGFSAPYDKYTEKDFTAQYNRRKEQEKNSPARLAQLKTAYETLMDKAKREALLEEEVEFMAE